MVTEILSKINAEVIVGIISGIILAYLIKRVWKDRKKKWF